MRKTSGTITGEIELNGFDQERTSFLRSSGYVEQFDVQQPELTVRETVAYSARLRLDANSPAIGNDDTKMMFVDHVLVSEGACHGRRIFHIFSSNHMIGDHGAD